MDVTVCIGTFGDEEWVRLANQRAIPSVADQDVPVIHHHGETLADARNRCLAVAESEFVIFLDADDSLGLGYVEAMAAGSADIRGPAVTYVRPNGHGTAPRVERVAGHRHDCTADCLGDGNWITIGAAARTETLREVGGFKEWPLYEDWDLWQRCWLAGASFEAVPDAIYRAHFRPDSRNRTPEMAFKNRIHREIVRANLPPDPIAA